MTGLASTTRPLAGACRCGRVGIAITAPPILTAACHCRGCQRMSASAYSLTALVPRDAFHVARGEPVKGGIRGPELDHFFCSSCMTWMFTRVVGTDAFVNVRPTMLDDPRWCLPFIETMTAEKLPWVETPARHGYAAFPPPADFQRLLEEFADQLRRQDASVEPARSSADAPIGPAQSTG